MDASGGTAPGRLYQQTTAQTEINNEKSAQQMNWFNFNDYIFVRCYCWNANVARNVFCYCWWWFMQVVANSFIWIICYWIISKQFLRIILSEFLCLFCLLWWILNRCSSRRQFMFSHSTRNYPRSLFRCASVVHWRKTRSTIAPISIYEWIHGIRNSSEQLRYRFVLIGCDVSAFGHTVSIAWQLQL